jgi:hypothetical protein
MDRNLIRIARWAAVLLPLSASAAAPDPQVMALRQQVAALQADHALALTQAQAQALLPVLQQGQTQLRTLEAQRDAARPALVAALQQAVADLKANGAISAATADALKAARPARPTGGDLRSVWQQAQQILSPAQVQALTAAKMGVSDGAGPHHGGQHGPRHAFRAMHVLLSDAFLALVQARAG